MKIFRCFKLSRVEELRQKGFGYLTHEIKAHYVHHDEKRQRYTFYRKVKECRAFDKRVAQLSTNEYLIK